MNILLTGHEGYLGCRLYHYLAEQGHLVIGVGRKQDIATITRSTLEENHIQLVVNCATAANRKDSFYEFGGADELVNVFGVRCLVNALRNTDIGLIHISSKDVFGEVYSRKDVTEIGNRLVPKFTVKEDTPFRPLTVYAKTKLMGEFIAESHSKTTIVRLSSGYTSELHRRGNWILHFCRAAKSKSPIHIYGSGKQLRDPLHADDLGALLLLIQDKGIWGYNLNAGGGLALSYSILEVLEMVAFSIPGISSPGGDFGYVTDNALASKLTGWKPRLSLQVELPTLLKKVYDE